MKPRYYIKTLTDDGRLIDVEYIISLSNLKTTEKQGFDSFDDAVAFLDRHDIHGAMVITVIERVK